MYFFLLFLIQLVPHFFTQAQTPLHEIQRVYMLTDYQVNKELHLCVLRPRYNAFQSLRLQRVRTVMNKKHKLLRYMIAFYLARSSTLAHRSTSLSPDLSRQDGHESHDEVKHHIHDSNPKIPCCRKAPVGASDDSQNPVGVSSKLCTNQPQSLDRLQRSTDLYPRPHGAP